MDTMVDAIRFVALAAAALAGGLVVREVIAGRDWVVAALLAAFTLCAAPVVVEAAESRALTWELMSVTVGVVLACVALGRARQRPAQVLQRVHVHAVHPLPVMREPARSGPRVY